MSAVASEVKSPIGLQALELEPKPAAPLVAQPASNEPINPQALINLVMAQGSPNVDQLERLLNLQQKWQEGEREHQRYLDARAEEQRKIACVLAFRRDFAAFRGEAIVVPKTKHVDRGRAGSFDQAEYHVFSQMLSPALSKHGFSFRHDQKFGSRKWTGDDGVERDVPWVFVTCFLEHRDGHTERLDLEGPPGETEANTPVQNMQVTASVLKRQSLAAITGTATGGEDDEALLRKRQATENREANELDALRAQGKDKAMSGMDSLLAWWKSIGSKQRNALSPDYPGWRRAAETADKTGAKDGSK